MDCMTPLGPNLNISRGAIFFDPPNPVFHGGEYGRFHETSYLPRISVPYTHLTPPDDQLV